MDKEKYLSFVASSLIVLILTLPFYTTSVYASIEQVSVKGSGNIEGFAKSNDFLTFKVKAELGNNLISNEQVVLGTNIKFDKCLSAINGGFECSFRFPSNGTDAFESRSQPFTINLLNEDKTLDDSKSGNITIDDQPPQVTLGSDQKFSSQHDVVINFEATDFACNDPSCANKCVGIRNIDFYTANGAFKQTVDLNTSDCNVKSSISIDPKTFRDGTNSVFAKAFDKFNQASEETSVTFEVDATGPIIDKNSFTILSEGISISTFADFSVPVYVVVNISGSDMDQNSVTADLSALNPSQDLKNAKASCISVDNGLSKCSWLIDLKPQVAGVKTFVIQASDLSGNIGTATISKQLTLDNQGPVVTSLSTTKTSNDQVLAKPSGNTVIATFDEETGLGNGEVFLNIGNAKISASSCSKDSTWTCIWNNVNFGSLTRMSIQPGTTDVLGNTVTASTSVDVSIDNTPPVLRKINISNVGGESQAFPDFFKIGDKIAVVANITELNDVTATADFSKFISGESNVPGTCQKIQGNENVCTWLTDSINLQAKDIATFNFSDAAGNMLVVTRSLKTYGLENAAVPDFWSSNVICSPKSIDRALGPLINEQIFCQVFLTPKSTPKSVSTVFISQATCSGDTSIVSTVETFNAEARSTSPIIKITLKKDSFQINNASLACSFDIFSKIGSSNTVTKNPEIENVHVGIGFFNLPLGELSDSVQKKIKDAKDSAAGIWKVIGTLNKIVNIARKICEVFGILYNIVAVFFTVAKKIGYFRDVVCANPFSGLTICPIAYTTATNTCYGQQAVRETVQGGYTGAGHWFCKIANCQFDFPGIIGEWQKGVKDTIDKYTPGSKYVNGGAASYLKPENSLIVSMAFVCLPGIIYNLDKYRQIKCLYADCLQNAVGKEGLPVTACEDEKAFSTCKYVTGEIFAFIPWTAFIDNILRYVKNALSNPFSAAGAGISAYCWVTCPQAPTIRYELCEGVKVLSQLGSVLGEIRNLVYQGFTVRQDYCSRLDFGNSTSSIF